VRSRVEGTSVVLRVTTFNRQTSPNLASGIKEQIEEAGGMDKVRVYP